MSSIHDRCRGRWPEILQHVGVDEAVLDGKHHPCPACGGEDRFRYRRDPDGGFFCGDMRANGIDLIMHLRGIDFQQAASLAEEVVGEDDNPKPAERTYAEKVRVRAMPLVESKYLASRGLIVPPGLQCIKSLPYYEGGSKLGDYPAILAPVTLGGSFRTYHATYLSNGAKAPVPKPRKVMPGKSIAGAAVRLWDAEEVLGVAEGIETAIAAGMLEEIPVWSVLSANGMRTFQWPQTVRKLVIFADNDSNLTGMAAAYHLANRALSAGLKVEIWCPAEVGKDMNDVLLGGRPALFVFGSE